MEPGDLIYNKIKIGLKTQKYDVDTYLNCMYEQFWNRDNCILLVCNYPTHELLFHIKQIYFIINIQWAITRSFQLENVDLNTI